MRTHILCSGSRIGNNLADPCSLPVQRQCYQVPYLGGTPGGEFAAVLVSNHNACLTPSFLTLIDHGWPFPRENFSLSQNSMCVPSATIPPLEMRATEGAHRILVPRTSPYLAEVGTDFDCLLLFVLFRAMI
jgi:hypothetical protein